MKTHRKQSITVSNDNVNWYIRGLLYVEDNGLVYDTDYKAWKYHKPYIIKEGKSTKRKDDYEIGLNEDDTGTYFTTVERCEFCGYMDCRCE
jgi:hypothetical protein